MNLPRTPAAVVFDMDGLIFDTERLQFRAAAAAAKSHGGDLPIDVFRELIGKPANTDYDILQAHFGGAVDFEPFEASWRANFLELVERDLDLKPGVVELLNLLDTLSLPRAIATSSQRSKADHHLAKHGLTERFDTVIAWGDYAQGKPAPDPYQAAARTLGVEPETCLALEDSHAGIRSAAAAGMMPIMVPDLVPANDEMHALATHVVSDLHEVCGLLRA
ncbi:HAD family hydrolase [Altericroceibacterium endophyticum]|uniref:HAD-IA family hydrolase n=1 Tax=Altericroceibacterium endophyticum TaxID=1808508 RepID=A0A6I4T1E8_9SPHN|nr:HAD family phosphatase [Altericroceibacterium endophyticum]MXO64756.1 HAD-IA family hydrolase [Altericroceibacterium endophyticum]